jgi:RNA polymerase sigma-70 factor (ECF subfamily)
MTITLKRRELPIKNEETQLIKRAKKGELQPFEVLVYRYQNQLRSYLTVRLSRAHEADDLAQESFVIAFSKLSDFDENQLFYPWLKGIASNLLKNYWRKNKELAVGSSDDLELLIEHEIELAVSNIDEGNITDALGLCIQLLAPDNKQFIYQHYHKGYSIKQLSEFYSSKHSTITMRLHRIRERLKQCITRKLKEGAL